MSKDLVLVTSEEINGIKCNFYKQGDEIWLSRQQIGEALGYSDPADAIKKIHKRSKERMDKFSRRGQIVTPSGKQEATIYNEFGVYEILMKSDQPGAVTFRDKVFPLFRALRTKTVKVIPTTEYEMLKANTHKINADANLAKTEIAKFNLLVSLGERLNLPDESRQAIASFCAERITGQRLLVEPKIDRTWTPAEMAAEFGVTSNRIGRIISELGIRPKENGKNEYGFTVLSQSPNSAHQGPAYRYNAKGYELIKREAKQPELFERSA